MAQGKRRDIGLCGAQTVSLADAREKARLLRAIARDGGNPLAERDKDRGAAITFEAATRRFHAEQIVPHAKNGKHVAQWLTTVESYAFPVMGAKPVDMVDQADVLRALSPMWTETPETARRVRQRVRAVLDWARAAGLRHGINPVEGVELGFPRQRDRVKHFAALPWQEAPSVMERVAATKGKGALALRLADNAAISQETKEAEQLRRWLVEKWREDFISASVAASRGCFKETEKNRRILGFLQRHGWVHPMEGGAMILGKHRREAWRINRGSGA